MKKKRVASPKHATGSYAVYVVTNDIYTSMQGDTFVYHSIYRGREQTHVA